MMEAKTRFHTDYQRPLRLKFNTNITKQQLTMNIKDYNKKIPCNLSSVPQYHSSPSPKFPLLLPSARFQASYCMGLHPKFKGDYV